MKAETQTHHTENDTLATDLEHKDVLIWNENRLAYVLEPDTGNVDIIYGNMNLHIVPTEEGVAVYIYPLFSTGGLADPVVSTYAFHDEVSTHNEILGVNDEGNVFRWCGKTNRVYAKDEKPVDLNFEDLSEVEKWRLQDHITNP